MASHQDEQPFRRGKAESVKQTDRQPKGKVKVPAGKKGKGKTEEAKKKNPTPSTTNPRKREP